MGIFNGFIEYQKGNYYVRKHFVNVGKGNIRILLNKLPQLPLALFGAF